MALQNSQRTTSSAAQQIGWFSLPDMRYPSEYVWLVFFSALDVILTGLILAMGGLEVNPIAMLVIARWGMGGAMVFKFALTLLAIIMCELVGRRQDVKGRWLVRVLIVLAAFPVAWSLMLLILGGPAALLEAVI